MDHDHNHIRTREQLKAYDPALAKLCADILGESEWRFVSPRKRAGKNHLKDYDPAKAPVVKELEHIKTAAAGAGVRWKARGIIAISYSMEWLTPFATFARVRTQWGACYCHWRL